MATVPNRRLRLLKFILILGGGLLALAVLTVLLILVTLNSVPRTQAAGLMEGVTVREFAILPDADAYPASVTVGPDGMVYTGSFASGAIWAIDVDGQPRELSGTRDAIGAVSGLAAAPDGSLYVVDQLDADPRTGGGIIWRVSPDGVITDFANIVGAGFLAPDDVDLDGAGFVYVSDRGRNEVWRFNPGGTDGLAWWTPTQAESRRHEPTGLAYDATHQAMIVTDPELNTIYRVSLADGSTEVLYAHGERTSPAGFDGVAVTSEGETYVAALGQNGVAWLRDDGELEYIAAPFRGASDVAYYDGKLYVTNFDQFSLLVPAVRPRLPFALDVIEVTLNIPD